VDNNGNVFVAATHDGGGYTTIAYSNNGVPLWTNRYNGPSSGDASGITVDSSGNVFVTGSSGSDSATIAYSSSGLPLWTNRFEVGLSKIALDSRGNVFVMGVSYATIKYSNAGVPLWTNRYNGGNAYSAKAIALDGTGNVFVSGWANTSGHSGYATIKYSNAGLPLWTNRYTGPANSDNFANAVAVDGSGNVIVTGSSVPANGYADYATVAYSNSGVPLWTNRYNGPINRGDSASAIAMDSGGNVFVAGSSVTFRDSVDDYADFATIKYSNSGVPLWTNLYDGPANQSDSVAAIAVDSGGNVFVTGFSRNNLIFESPASWDYATIGYSSSGEPLWENRYNGPDNVWSWAQAIAVDPAGNVFVTGYARGNDDHAYYTTIKYSSSLPPSVQLDFQLLNNQLVLSWTNAGFSLQSAPALTGPFTNILGATSPFTNAFTGGQNFFRLKGD